MKKPQRFDVMKLDGYEVTPQGFLRIPVFAARTGIQHYRDAKGQLLTEYRPADEVFSQKTMASLRNCPFTNDHPSEMVTAENADKLVCGMTGDSVERVEDKFLKTYVTVYNKKAIADVKAGKVEVSMGYDVELDFTPGEYQGQKYDAVQRNIVHNHIALVHRARGGREVRLRLDGQDAILVTDEHSDQGDPMKIKLAGKEFEVSQEIADAFGAHMTQIDTEKKAAKDAADAELATVAGKVKELETAATASKTEKESLQAKVDSLEDEKKKGATARVDAATIESAVKARRRLDKVAQKVMKPEDFAKTDSMDAGALKKAIIQAEFPEAKLDGQSDAYLDGRFEHIAEGVEKSEKTNAKTGADLSKKRKEDGDREQSDADKAREKSMKEDRERWRQKPGKASK